MKLYNITYSCGCVHEIQEGTLEGTGGMHKPTGNNKDCDKHKSKEVENV